VIVGKAILLYKHKISLAQYKIDGTIDAADIIIPTSPIF